LNTDKSREVADAGLDANSVEPGVWRYVHARRASLVVDGEDYFDLMRQAMLKAQDRIMLIGWDFDTRIHLRKGRRWWEKGWRKRYPRRLGSFILWLARHREHLDIRILKWNLGTIKFLVRGTMILDLLRWWLNRKIDFKFDSAHPLGCSHHQKLVIIDDSFAVCGGIDMAARRWDTRDHLEHDERRVQPNGSHYEPWHDMAMLMEGDIAQALGELGRSRWREAGGKPLMPCKPHAETAWPDELSTQFEDVEIGIARSLAAYNGRPKVDEVEELFLRQIASAKRFLYIENQYFSSRSIAEAMAQRLREDDPPEIVVVHPVTADGWIESKAMDPARTRLVQALRECDHKARFHIYAPYTGDTSIYVHAKLMIVDDCLIRVGSTNFNNRSFGLDSECDVFIDCSRPGNSHARDVIRSLRHSLLAEHCGITPEEVARLLDQAGSMAAMIAALGDRNRRRLVPFQPAEPGEWEVALAERQMFDPEEPAELFQILPPNRGLFRPGSLLAKAMRKVRRKAHKK